MKLTATKKMFYELGGPDMVAKKLNQQINTVYKWGDRGIPFYMWERFIKIFNLSPEKLYRVSAEHIKK